jgi:PLP dependent protein
MYDEHLSTNLPRVQERVAAALERSGRTGAVRLVAVTKGHPLEAVLAAVRAGIGAVGENRVQELDGKVEGWPTEQAAPEWHLIGHLQRNKVRRAVQLSTLIHSIDSPRLAEAVSEEGVRRGEPVRVLAQVNVSGEASKGGFDGDAALGAVAAAVALPGLRVEGLMTMAPFTDDEAVVRGTFAATRRLLEELVRGGAPLHGRELSMGMSGDYEWAIEEGSTMIRLGTVLFGERTQ